MLQLINLESGSAILRADDEFFQLNATGTIIMKYYVDNGELISFDDYLNELVLNGISNVDQKDILFNEFNDFISYMQSLEIIE